MAANGILQPTRKMILKKYYPLPVRQSPVLPHPEIPLCLSSLPCTELESSEDDQIERGSLEALADGSEEERSEIPLAGEPDDKTGKHRDGEQIPLERAHFSEGEGKVVPKRAFPALKSPSACKGLEGLGELHLEMQQIVDQGKVMLKRECPALKSPPADVRLDKSVELHPLMQQVAVGGFSRADCTRSTDQAGNLSFQADIRVNTKTTPHTCHRSPDCEAANEPETAKDGRVE